MTNQEAKQLLDNYRPLSPIVNKTYDMAITALELMDTLIDRPCSACRYHKENGCCKWNCVFDGHIGKKGAQE